ncbi:MAG TPA: PilZ domain-containing protein [Blastocatellia bacterium]|nr:PilZ domain-containing protein [Blastocatellia bacterium]
MTIPITERRKNARLTCFSEIISEALDSQVAKPRLRNISTGGAFIESAITLPTATTIPLKIKLKSQEIEVQGEVCHQQAGVGMGVKFHSISEAQKQIIENYIWENSVALLQQLGDEE